MNFLRQIRIGQRLALGFALLLVLLAAIVGLSLQRMAQQQARLTEVTEVQGIKVDLASRMGNTINRIGVVMRDGVFAELDEDRRSSVIKLAAALRNYEETEAELAKLLH
jgi:methyl-accepting chemotaxis protein